jgi:Tfp pilus assembly protein PilF
MYYRALPLVLGFVVATTAIAASQTADFRSTGIQEPDGALHSAIAGVVTAADGTPLNNIRIELHSFGTGALVATSFTRINGSFDFQVRPGRYEIVAFKDLQETRQDIRLDNQLMNVTLQMSGRATAPKRGTVSVAQLRTPEKARNLVEKAKAEYGKGHSDEAKKKIAQALSIAPDYADALTFQAAMKLSENQPQAALDDLDHALKADPSYAPAYVVLGATFNQMGRYDEALRSLDRGSIYEPNSWQCAYEASKAWLAKKDYAHALQQISRAESLGAVQMAGPLHLLKGYALMGQKKLDQAASELQAYLTAEPNSQLAGSARAALARIKTEMAQNPASVPLPAMTGFFANAH